MQQYEIEVVEKVIHSGLLTKEKENTIQSICNNALNRNRNIGTGTPTSPLPYPYNGYSTYYSVTNKL